jgi:hypothetical protein
MTLMSGCSDDASTSSVPSADTEQRPGGPAAECPSGRPPAGTAPGDAEARFPLRFDDEDGAILDQAGEPYLVVGDAAWSMLVQLDLDETERYLEARRQQGFNTLLVNLVEHRFSDAPPLNASGQAPFEAAGDFSRPNPAYFDSARAALELTRDHGFVVLLVPAYLGYEGGDEGWYEDMVRAGGDGMYSYGRFVGERFADLDNIVWTYGGDFTPPPEDLDLVERLRDGIIAGGARQPSTAHWAPETSASDVGVDWLDLDTTYTYGPVYAKSSTDDTNSPLPRILLESQYEDDIFDNTRQRLRSQAYEAVLTGASGSVFGNGTVWQFASGWEESLWSEGAADFVVASTVFSCLPWASLRSDVGIGQLVADPGTFGEDSYVVAAGTPDKRTVMAYVPDERDARIDLGGTPERFQVTWVDPVNGLERPADPTPVDATKVVVAHPGLNEGSDADWFLLVSAVGNG